MTEKGKGDKQQPRVEWFKQEKACRPGGATGAYKHHSDCIWKDCCARFLKGFPEQPNICSCRAVVQANSMEITFPRSRR
jgi:hypothetical protein